MSDLATVTRADPRGMITLRGDLTSSAMKTAIKLVTRQAVPAAGKIAGDGTRGVTWMSPDELLVMVPYDEVGGALDEIGKALSGQHFLAENVSDARALFLIEGANAREVLARVCPVDLHKASFTRGDFRRTRMAQVAAAFWMDETGFDLVCFRSVGDYVERLLRNAAKGAPVGALD